MAWGQSALSGFRFSTVVPLAEIPGGRATFKALVEQS